MATFSRLRTPGGPGVTEHQLVPSTGLRAGSVSAILSNSSAFCVTVASGLANSTAWQTVPINRNPNLPLPCTPCITATFADPLGGAHGSAVWGARLTGFGLFGEPISEEFDSVPVSIHANTTGTLIFHIWMSRVFSAITKIEMKCSVGVNIAAALIQVGAWFTWDDDKIVTQDVDLGGGANKDEEILIFNKNQGIGIPRIINATHRNDPYDHKDIRSFIVETASAVAAETNYANIEKFSGGAGGGGYIVGQYRGAADTINANVYNYTSLIGDENKLRIDRNATDTILAMDNATGMTFYTGGTTAFVSAAIKRYTLNVYTNVGARVGGGMAHGPNPAF